MSKYKLRLKRLDFVSVVDTPAQEPATCLLIKRAGNKHEIEATARFVKADPKLGLAFFWAVTDADQDGNPYFDLQGDQVVADDALVKAAMDFMENGGAVDQQHDSSAIGKTVFMMPMTPDIATAFGITTKRHGLMVAVKPSADVLAKLESGEYTGVSIAGIGEREKVASASATKAIREALESPIGEQLIMRALAKAVWSASYIDDLPDGSFLYIEPGGQKDSDGKTTPRSLRHFPFKDSTGKVDMPHLRDAIGRIPQSSLPGSLRDKLQAKAEKLLGQQHDASSSKRLRKMVVLTSVEDGHQHAIDLDDPADWCGDKLCTSPATAAGAEMSHTHAWTFDRQSGEVTIATDAGHSHTVADKVPQNVLSMFALDEQQEQQQDAQRLLEQVLDGGAGGDVTVTIAARDPRAGISTPTASAKQGGLNSEGTQTMADPKIIVLTEREHAHLSKLTGADRDAFLAKSATEREAVLKAAQDADPVVFKGELTGTEVRKSDGDLARKLAEQNEQFAKTQKAQAEQLAKRDAEIEKAEIRKIATEHLGALAGSDDVHDLVIGALRKSGADQAKIAEALTAMKAWNALAKTAARVKGVDPGVDAQPGSALEAYEKGLETFAKARGAKHPLDVAEAFLKTDEGKDLYAAYKAEHPAYQHSQPRQ